MPDLDLIRAGVSLRFRKTYDLLNEGAFDPNHIARVALDDIRKQLRYYGLGPVTYIGYVTVEMDEAQTHPLLVDWASLHSRLRELMHNIEGNPRGIQLAHRASSSQAVELQYKGVVVTHESLLKRYIRNVFEADLTERLPFVRGANHAIIQHRLTLIDDPVDVGIDLFARQIAARGDLKHLHRPAQEKEPVDLEMDLLALK